MTSANRRVRDDQNLLPLQPDLARSEGRSAFISLNDLLYAALNLAKIVHLGSLFGFSGLIFDPVLHAFAFDLWTKNPVGWCPAGTWYVPRNQKETCDRSLIQSIDTCSYLIILCSWKIAFQEEGIGGRTWLLCWSTAHLHRVMKLKGWVKSNSKEALCKSSHLYSRS